ncbi:hypothetical protein [Actinospica robiniae]|uniref:hypothetical protein n=1 Tax=Actinospica robiniae TaxID=304901 RepID=UPI0003F8DDD9|nr:hypothetical protein [Actinospica robiniae]
MDRLAVHVIATAALTLTLATVPVLFADACHASSSAAPQTATTRAATHASSTLALAPAIAVLPALSGQTQTKAAAAAAAGSAFAPPAADGSAPAPADRRPGHGRVLLPELREHPCVSTLLVEDGFAPRHPSACQFLHG